MAAKSRPVLIAVAFLVMASVACSLFSGGSKSFSFSAESTVSVGGSSEQDIATPEPQEESTQAEASGAESSSSSGSDESSAVDSLDKGLEALDSYRMQFTMTVDGKDDKGEPKSGSFSILQEVNRKTNEQHFKMSGLDTFGSGQSSGSGAWEVFNLADATYMLSTDADGKASCTSFSDSSQQDSTYDVYKPSELLGSLSSAKLTKKGVDVNGVKTDEYKVKDADLSFGVFTQGDASFWVAQKEQYVVKYSGQATGKTVGILNVDGTVKWDYAVDQANQLPAIALPAECEAQKASSDVPIPDNATEKSTLGKMVMFNSPDAVSAVADYYRSALPEQGWTAGEESSMGEDMTVLNYTKDARKLSITITKGDKGASVILNEE